MLSKKKNKLTNDTILGLAAISFMLVVFIAGIISEHFSSAS